MRGVRPQHAPNDPQTGAPPLSVQRRRHLRRASDRATERESLLLAETLDELATAGTAAERLRRVLLILARSVGSDVAALLVTTPASRVAVAWTQDASASTPASVAASLTAGAAGEPIRLAPPSPTGRTRRAPTDIVSRPIQDEDGARIAFALPHDVELPSDAVPSLVARHAVLALRLYLADESEQLRVRALELREAESGAFLGTVAHEIRTPLASLTGYIDLLAGEHVPDPDDRAEFLARCQGLTDTLAVLTSDILDVGRLRAGALALEQLPFSAADLARAVADTLHPETVALGADLALTLPSRLRVAVGDRRRAQQILLNLVGNALKFSGPSAQVELDVRPHGTATLFTVRDAGPGIADDEQELIFERFYRAEAAEGSATGTPGTGLGLAIARELARGMGGEIGVASIPGRGSTFVLALAGTSAPPTGGGRTSPSGVHAALADALRDEHLRLVRAAAASDDAAAASADTVGAPLARHAAGAHRDQGRALTLVAG
jgi:hypothetical protein